MPNRFHFACAVAATIVISAAVVAQEKTNVSIGTGFASGVYFPMGNGLAALLSKYVPGYSVKVEATGGSVDNLKLLSTSRIDVGFSMADATWDAFTGTDKFKGGKLPVRALLVLYPNSLHVLALDRSDVVKVSDLKGKQVATGAAGSATEVMALRLLEAYGIDKEVKRHRLSLEDSVAALKEKKVDAIFWSGGVPTAAINGIAGAGDTKFKLIDHDDAVDKMTRKHGPLYAKHVIPANVYAGITRPTKVAGVWNILVVNESMPDQVAYNIVKTIFEHRAEMVAAHKEAENISLAHQKNSSSPIPFHRGAIRYFAEKGIALK